MLNLYHSFPGLVLAAHDNPGTTKRWGNTSLKRSKGGEVTFALGWTAGVGVDENNATSLAESQMKVGTVYMFKKFHWWNQQTDEI